jgi:hypothetical protein
MRTPARDFALAYFENRAKRPRLAGFAPGTNYRWSWFDPRGGSWSRRELVKADAQGVLQAPPFPRRWRPGRERPSRRRSPARTETRPGHAAACPRMHHALTHSAFTKMLRPRGIAGSARESIMRPTERFAGYFFIGVAGLLAAPLAQAQQSTADEAASANEPKLEEVVVTGSRIRQDSQEFREPGDDLFCADHPAVGKTDLGDFLAQTPALVGSTTGDLTAGSNPRYRRSGIEPARPAPPGRGSHVGIGRWTPPRRPASAGSAAVDIDSIPHRSARVGGRAHRRRVRGLRRDGVSGVVNFRLKKNFEGISFRGQDRRFRRRLTATTPSSR